MYIEITTDTIRLDSALKFAGLCQTGGEAKIAIQMGMVTLNDLPCSMRSKQIKPNDIIKYKNETVEVRKK